MTITQFQDKHGSEFNTFISSATGQAFLNIMAASQPVYKDEKEPHLYADNRGCKRGYEAAIRNIVALTVTQKQQQQPEADYGVPEKKAE